jgi:hypothetical protein
MTEKRLRLYGRLSIGIIEESEEKVEYFKEMVNEAIAMLDKDDLENVAAVALFLEEKTEEIKKELYSKMTKAINDCGINLSIEY